MTADVAGHGHPRHRPHPWIVRRRQEGPPKVRDASGPGVNGQVALTITGAVGSMWAAYLFAAVSLAGMPLWAPAWLVQIVQWVSQNFIQLVLLSIILVGQNVQAVASDRRAEQTYQDAEAILHECLRLHDHLEEQDLSLMAAMRVVAAADPAVARLIPAEWPERDVHSAEEDPTP